MNIEIRRDIEKIVLMSDVKSSDVLACRDEIIAVIEKYELKKEENHVN